MILTAHTPAHSNRHRMLFGAGALGAGVFFGLTISVGSALVFYLCAVVFGVCALALKGRAPWWALAGALFALGAGRAHQTALELPAEHIERYLQAEPQLVHLEGVVGGDTRVVPRQVGRLAAYSFGGEVTRFTLTARALLGEAGARTDVVGRVWVRADGRIDRLRAGDVVRVRGYASLLGAPRNPGETDIRPSARARDIGGRVYGCSDATIEVLDIGAPTYSQRVQRIRDSGRARASGWIERAQVPAVRALLGSMLYGMRARTGEAEDIGASFRRTGLGHLLALSGLHLGALAFLTVFALRATLGRPYFEAIVLFLVLAVYLSIVPVRAPIFRAAVMFGVLGIGEAMGRRHSRLALLGLAAVLVLLWRPTELLSPGFQLSFGIVLALIVLAGRLRKRLFGERKNRDEINFLGAVLEWTKDLGAASLCAWLVSVPIGAYHFGTVSPMTAPASMVGIPLAGVTLGFGYLASLASVLHPSIGEIVGWPAVFFGGVLVWFVQWVDGWQAASFAVPSVSAVRTLGATAVAVWWLWGGRVRSLRGGVACVLLVAVSAGQFGRARLDDDVVVRADMLAVGDGTCILVRSGRDALLFDCGSGYFAVGERTVPDAVRALGGWRTPRVFLSHPNLDHFNGLVDAAGRLGVREVITSESVLHAAGEDAEGAMAQTLGELSAVGIPVRTTGSGDSFALGETVIDVLWPARGATFRRDNDSSIVLVIRAETEKGEKRVVLCGDIEKEGLEGVSRVAPELKADIMEVPHHGSAKPTAYAFVDELDPAVALQSTGPRRMNDERWDDVKEGRVWLMTAQDGAVWAEIMRDGEVQGGKFRE